MAIENYSLDRAREYLPQISERGRKVLSRLAAVRRLPDKLDILEIGSAQGQFLIACAQMGHRAYGVEPSAQARCAAQELASDRGVAITIVDGIAEDIPLAADSFDVVYAASVIEHVGDADAAFREAHRVLRPGGIFWFSTASSLCPKQMEIRGFPAFSWYPNPLKLRIMEWACRKRPDLIGHTSRPAIHWFTPWKARRMLHAAGFGPVYDRWDIVLPAEVNPSYHRLLTFIKKNAPVKLLADVLMQDCSYAAVK